MPEMQHPSHEDYVNKYRAEVLEVAQKILEGTIGVMEGSHHLSTLIPQAELRRDKDFILFLGISNEYETLPPSHVRQYWNPKALEKKDEERREYEAEIKDRVFEACQRILEKSQ